MTDSARSPVSRSEWASISALTLGAAAFSAYCGSRGLFAFDESIVFDGGFRVLSGQVPYRDFLIPFGPVPFLLQGLFFAFFGVNWPAYLAHAAVINGAAAFITWWLVRGVAAEHPSVRVIALLSAGTTAVWFYPPMGVPFFEQTAFFLHLCGLAALQSRRRGSAAVAGVLFALVLLSKQNAGVISIAMGLWIAWRSGVFRLVAAGVAGAGLLFTAWLAVVSDSSAFLRAFAAIPLAEAGARLERMDSLAGGKVTLPGAIECGVLCFAAIWLIRQRGRPSSDRQGLRALEIAVGVFAFRLGFECERPDAN